MRFPFYLIGFAVLLSVHGCVKTAEKPVFRPLTIVCFGDSLTACGGEGGRYSDWLQKWLPDHTIVNKGIGGDTLATGRHRFERDVLLLKPDIVILELGANDWWQRARPIEALHADLEAMVSSARAQNAAVVIASCFGRADYYPGQSDEFTGEPADFGEAIWRMEVQIADKYDAQYVPNMQVDIKRKGMEPYWADKNHPNKAGNRFVAERLLPCIKAAIESIYRRE